MAPTKHYVSSEVPLRIGDYVCYLELKQIITRYQSGFRKHFSIVDHLIRLETFIREAFIKKKTCYISFYVVKEAYDTTWKFGIITVAGQNPYFYVRTLSLELSM